MLLERAPASFELDDLSLREVKSLRMLVHTLPDLLRELDSFRHGKLEDLIEESAVHDAPDFTGSWRGEDAHGCHLRYPGSVPTRRDWSEAEVEAVVADYFSMLEKELRGIPYNKTEHRNALRPLLADRSDASVEKKHQNISAVLMGVRFPYIRGYKPLPRYQRLLADIVLEHLEDDAVLSDLALRFAEAAAEPPPVANVLDLMTTPPRILTAVRSALAKQPRLRHARRIDYLEREARNRALGANGEALVVRYERARLSSLGHGILAERVEHVAETRGDGLGYDVLSYSPTGHERFIEVKTTQLGPLTPFYVTANEMTFSGEHPNDYSLYRVYEFASTPRMFALDGRVEETCRMTPAQYVAVPR